MKFHIFEKTLVSSLSFTLVIALVGTFYSQTSSGQTAQERTAASNANLTVADFNALTSDFITTRQAILDNDRVTAYNAINEASDKLFSLAQNAGNETVLMQLNNEFRPIQNNIDNIRDALRENDITQAVNSLATADVRTVNITKGLPPGEAEVETAE